MSCHPDDLPTCALVVGHRPGDGGCESVADVGEYEFNTSLARDVAAVTAGARVQIVQRDDDAGGYNRLPSQINAVDPDFVVEMHFNCVASPEATGSEVLHWPGSEGGEKLASMLLGEFVEALQLPNRGTKARHGKWVNGRWRGERGSYLLGNTRAPCTITEPFFGSNPDDWRTATERKDLLAMAYKRGIEQFANSMKGAVA